MTYNVFSGTLNPTQSNQSINQCSCALLGGFAIGACVIAITAHSAEREMSASACTRSMAG